MAIIKKSKNNRNFPDGPVLGLCAPNSGVTGLVPTQGTKTPHAAQHHQKIKIISLQIINDGEHWRKRKPCTYWWECKLVQPQWKTVSLKNYKLPYDPATVLLSIQPEKTKALIRKDTYTPVFIVALFTTAKTPSETVQVSINR